MNGRVETNRKRNENMQFREFGLILFVEHFEECIAFYKDILQLRIRNKKGTLVSFEIPNGYLMIEQGGIGSRKEKLRDQNPTVLRFDVESLVCAVEELEEHGVHFLNRGLTFDWGTIAVLNDPDGNRIELAEIDRKSCSYTKG